ncbi:hypothetical protein [Planctomycetes bacterium Pan216]
MLPLTSLLVRRPLSRLKRFLASPRSLDRQSPRHLERLEERAVPAHVTVTNLTDHVDGNTANINELLASPGTDGSISLREAVLAANADDAADVIEFADGLEGTIPLSNGEIRITRDLTIAGPGADKLTIDAQDNSRIFSVTDHTGAHRIVSLSDMTLTRGYADGPDPSQSSGGAIYSRESLTLDGLTITNSKATGSGGIYLFSAGTVESSIISARSRGLIGGRVG